MSESPNVIQGRLGWEDGDISEAKPEELRPHPKNAEIYGDTDDADDLDEAFVESVREKGVLEPLVITDGKEIISGHRRWLAAKATNTDRVPVRKSSFESDLEEREALIEFNRQREKTPGQIVNEFEEMLEIEKTRGKETQGSRTTSTKNLVEEEGDAQTRAAEKINADVSGETLRKGKNIKEKAESDDEPEEVREAAREAWDGLQSNDENFSSAYRKVKDAEQDSDEQDDEDGEHTVVDAATKQETDEWSSPRELVEPIADAVDGFDLDPCSGAERSPFAADTYTADDDGLEQSWYGRVWVNPPYSAMSGWTAKATTETRDGDAETVVYLCKGDSSTGWWQRAASCATVICAIDHRLSFGDGENSAPFASHLIVFGECPDALAAELANHGQLLKPTEAEQ